MHSSAVFGVGYRQQGNAKAGVFCSSTFCLMGAPAGRFKVGHWDVTVKKCEVRTAEKEGAYPWGVVCSWKAARRRGNGASVCVLAHSCVREACQTLRESKCWCIAKKAVQSTMGCVQFTGCKGKKIVIWLWSEYRLSNIRCKV